MTLFAYLMIMLGIMFWIFRAAVALTASMNIAFFVLPLNLGVEISLLFLTLVSFILIFKKPIIGTLLYMLSHFAYFGVYLYNIITEFSGETVVTAQYSNLFIAILGVLIPFLLFLAVGLNSGKKSNKDTKGTSWFYGSNDYDREYDERADHNQYKF